MKLPKSAFKGNRIRNVCGQRFEVMLSPTIGPLLPPVTRLTPRNPEKNINKSEIWIFSRRRNFKFIVQQCAENFFSLHFCHERLDGNWKCAARRQMKGRRRLKIFANPPREAPVKGSLRFFISAHEIHKFLNKVFSFANLKYCPGQEKDRFNLPIPNLQTWRESEMETDEFGFGKLRSNALSSGRGAHRLRSQFLLPLSAASSAHIFPFFCVICALINHGAQDAGNSGEKDRAKQIFVHNCCSRWRQSEAAYLATKDLLDRF